MANFEKEAYAYWRVSLSVRLSLAPVRTLDEDMDDLSVLAQYTDRPQIADRCGELRRFYDNKVVMERQIARRLAERMGA